jgi:hypothetical protein
MVVALGQPVGDLSRAKLAGNRSVDVDRITKTLVALDPDFEMPTGEDSVRKLAREITDFQKLVVRRPDGWIGPTGATIRQLNRYAAGKAIVVSLKRQVLVALQGLARTETFDCTSGDHEHPTPPGSYSVYRKERIYRSKKYDAQMNHAMFFHRGYAIHQAEAVAVTSVLRVAGLEFFGSHGCVRLAESDARELFDWAGIGTPVLIWPAVR